MLTENDLRELVSFSAAEPVLSVYLNTDPAVGNADASKLRLRTLLKEVNLPQDVEAVQRYFDLQRTWSGRGVAVFSCAPQKFFKAFSLASSVHDLVHVGNRPSVKTLADLLDVYGGYGVVLVDKQGARLFFFHMGELREHEGVFGETVRHTKLGGASTFPGRRGGVTGQTHYADEVVERNMKDTAEIAVHFFEENRVRRILIGGTDENVVLLRNSLPKAWQSLVVGTFPMAMTATSAEVLGRVLQIGREIEQKREAWVVDAVITGAAKGSGAVIGLASTLEHINAGRVQTLVVSEGFKHSGYNCSGCSHLTLDARETCSGCSGRLVQVPDIIDLAVSAVMRSGGEVNIVHNSAQLDKAGSIGVILRY